MGAALGDPSSWRNWFTILRAASGLPLNAQEAAFFAQIAGGRSPPTAPCGGALDAAGRGSGKSRIAGAMDAYIATCVNHKGKLAPGETGMILTLSASKAQADAVHGYAEAFISASPLLSQRVADITGDQIRLQGNITIATHTNSFRTIRGRTLLACVFDEFAFWRDKSSANPDVEVYTAVVPMLARYVRHRRR